MKATSVPQSDGLLRFNLAMQSSRAVLYATAFLTFLIGKVLGVAHHPLAPALIVLVVAMSNAALFYTLYKYRVDVRSGISLTPFWLTVDVLLGTGAVYATGGFESPWFIWFLAVTAGAAFAAGSRAAVATGAATVGAYFILLWAIGAFTDQRLVYVAIARMVFLYGTGYVMLRGITTMRERRLVIRQLREEDAKKVDELTRLNAELLRLTGELDQRTRELELSNAQLAHANQAIREADRMKSQFLANMSHELRTPLNSIIGFSEILNERLETTVEPKYRNFLNLILNSGEHLLSLINDILDLSKIEAGRMEFTAESFPVRPTIESVCRVMRGAASRVSIAFEVDVPDDIPPIESDLVKFKQVLYNLLSNAVKFSPPGSSVSIRARRVCVDGSELLEVSVEDQGIGIAKENFDLIFREFVQIHPQGERQFGGTGLGLSLVRRFVEYQKGTVSVESELGKGSRFTFRLPYHFEIDEAAEHIADGETSLFAGDRG